MKMTSLGLLSLTALALAGQASAQTINIDIDNFYGTPSNGLAAAGVAGVWNNISATTAGSALLSVTGASTAATITRTSGTGGAFNWDNLATTGDDQALLDDAQDPGLSSVWTIAHLTAGTYNVFTYAWAPDDPSFRSGISINGSPVQSVGGNFAGSYVQGTTHAANLGIVVPADGSIVITISVISSYSTFNGVQIVNTTPPPPPYTPFCFGDGSSNPCPCGNVGTAGNGCPSSVNASGANLAASGVASISNDTMSLDGTGMTNSSALYFQGTAQVAGGLGAAFGDGLRCAGGTTIRLGTKSNAGGSSSYPSGSLPISVKGNCAAGNVRTYQCWYRNAAAFCNPETFNLTNGVQATWAP